MHLYKTAESVTPSHPDKVCDQISDAVLDACLAQDPHTRAAIEVLGGHGLITITGELTTGAHINIRDIAKETYRNLGYSEQVGITVNVVEQSREIGKGSRQRRRRGSRNNGGLRHQRNEGIPSS